MRTPRANTPSILPPVDRRVVMAVVGAPHGVRGEARVKCFTQDPMALCDYGPLFISDGRSFTIASARPLKDDMLVVRFEGISDRDAIAALTRSELFIDREALPPVADEDEFYQADLIGLDIVTSSGEKLGTLIAIHDFGAGDVLDIRPDEGGGTWFLPFTKIAAPKVDTAARTIIVDPAYLMKPEPAHGADDAAPDA